MDKEETRAVRLSLGPDDGLLRILHANLCNKNRSISAESVKEIATKFGCPSEYTTKVSKLGWIFLNKLQA